MGPLGHSAAAVAALVALPVGLVGAALRPSLAVGWRERLGLRDAVAPGGVWVHGASVGEVQAALGLMDALEASAHPVVASAMTATGRAILRTRRPRVPSALAPLDHPWCIAAALRRVRPAALVFVETELWPAWLLGARDAGVPVIFVSARLSDRSFPRYRRAARLLRPLLAGVAAVGARAAQDAERFVSLGVPAERVEVTGDLKLEPAPSPEVLLPEFARVLGDVPLLVAGSTHEGEEEAAVGALAAAEQAGLAVALVLAPRHPRRFGAAEWAARSTGRRVRRRSALGDALLQPGEVVVLDSIGELTALWPRADVAFVGGSLARRGGHNVTEPARAGRAVLFGPHTTNVSEAAAILLDAGGARRVVDAADLAAAVVEALRDPAAWSARGKQAAAALEGHRGATERSLALVRRVLGEAGA